MKFIVVSTQYCKQCQKKVRPKDAKLGREQLSADCERIFFCCPDCGTEIEDEVVPEPWAAYCRYLQEWADSHADAGFEGCCPVCYEEFLECEWKTMQEELAYDP